MQDSFGWLEFVLGGGTVGAALLVLFKITVERAFKKADESKASKDAQAKAAEAKIKEEHERQREFQRREFILRERLQQKQGRYLYWMCKGAMQHEELENQGYWNGELEEARKCFEKAEHDLKELQREMLSHLHDEAAK